MALTFNFGPYEFDRVAYDSEGDVLYLGRSESEAAIDTVATPEGHAVRLNEDGEVIGITIVNAKWLVERDGKLSVTVPSLIKANAAAEGVAITAGESDHLFSTHVPWNAS